MYILPRDDHIPDFHRPRKHRAKRVNGLPVPHFYSMGQALIFDPVFSGGGLGRKGHMARAPAEGGGRRKEVRQ